MDGTMSGKRYQHVNTAEYQDLWRSQRSVDSSTSYLGKGSTQAEPVPNPNPNPNPNLNLESVPNPNPNLNLEAAKVTAGKEKPETYPPIVTIDGRVDTDIDHLIDDLNDDYTGPVDEIPSKFPKPHVFSVVDGSLDDDVDSYANDDGTMEHTLVDAPKNFNPRDLKDVASSDITRKSQGHVGQISVSHTDRSHNKMYVDPPENDPSCDPEVRRFMSKKSSTEQLNSTDSTREMPLPLKSARNDSHEDLKKPKETERQQPSSVVRRISSAGPEGGKTRNNLLVDSDRQSSSQSDHHVQDTKRGQTVTKVPRFGSPGSGFEPHRHGMIECDTESPFNSRALMPLKCDSGSYAPDMGEHFSNFKERRAKDRESPVYLHGYTESLTCTYTDVSYRESHVDVDLSLLRLEQEQSRSVSETDSESDQQDNKERPQRIYGNFDYGLQAKVGPDFEHTLFHFPCYSDESLTKSSELYPRSRYVTQSNTHFSSVQALDSYNKHNFHTNDCLTTSESMRSSQSLFSSTKKASDSGLLANSGTQIENALQNQLPSEAKPDEKPQPVSVQQTSVQQASFQQTRGQQTNVQQTSVQQASFQQTRGQQTSVQQNRGQQTNVQQTSVQQTRGQQTNVQQTSVQQTRGQQTSVQQTSVQQTRGQQTNVQQTSVQQTRGQQTSVQQTSVQQTRGQQTSAQQAILTEYQEKSSPFESLNLGRSSQETCTVIVCKSSETTSPHTFLSLVSKDIPDSQTAADKKTKQKPVCHDTLKQENTVAESPPTVGEAKNPQNLSPTGELDQNKYLNPSKQMKSPPKTVDRQPLDAKADKDQKLEIMKKEQCCGEDLSPTCDHAVQVKIERVAREVNEMEESRVLGQQEKSPARAQTCRPVETDESLKYRKVQEVISNRSGHISKPEDWRTGISETDSLDSESKHLLQQLKMVQINKKKADEILKHVQNILEKESKYAENLADVNEEHEDEDKQEKVAEQTPPKSTGQSLGTSPRRSDSPAALKKETEEKNEERDSKESHERDDKFQKSDCLDTADKGIVQSLVKSWDTHHRWLSRGLKDVKPGHGPGPTQGKPAKPQPEVPDGYTNKSTAKHVGEANKNQPSPTGQRHLVSPRHDLSHQDNVEVNRSHRSPEARRDLCKDGADSDKRSRRSYHEKGHHAPKHISGDPRPVPAVRRAVPPNSCYDSTSLASCSTDSVCTYKECSPVKRHAATNKYLRDDASERRPASVPRKTKASLVLKRKTSPDVCTTKDLPKSKRRSNMDSKRNNVRKPSIQDSLRVAFRVAEESMTAAARVAEALNVVMRASQISPPSSSSVEEKYMRRQPREQNVSPGARSKRSDSVTASKVKPKSTSSKIRSPKESPRFERGSHKVMDKKKSTRKADLSRDRSEAKAAQYKTQEAANGHKTSLSSPSRRDTFSRNPKNIRAARKQREGHVEAAIKPTTSRGSISPAEYSPKAWGDISKVNKDLVDHCAATTGQQVTIQIALTPESPRTQETRNMVDRKKHKRDRADCDRCPKEGGSFAAQDDTLSFESVELLEKPAVLPQESPHARDKNVKRSHEMDKSNLKKPITKSMGHEQSSDVTLSKEEWVIPNSYCSSTRKTDGYFTQVPALFDHKLQSISLSAKRVIRNQLIGSCVDPGLTDSAGSDSIEFNANFNRSIASKQQPQFSSESADSGHEKYIMNAAGEATSHRKRSDPFTIWQQGGTFHRELDSPTCATNLYQHSDNGTSSSLIQSIYEDTETELASVSRGHQDGVSRGRGSVGCRKKCREAVQLYTEEVVQVGDYLESCSVKQDSPQCVATLCYTDLSSPSSFVADPCETSSFVPPFPQCRVDHEKGSEDYLPPRRPHENILSQQKRASEQQPCLQDGQLTEEQCQKCTAPAPKPRVRTLQNIETENFPFPGRAPKFSPIYEEMWSEEEVYGHLAKSLACPDCNKRVQNSNGRSCSNNSNNNNSNNNNSNINNNGGDEKAVAGNAGHAKCTRKYIVVTDESDSLETVCDEGRRNDKQITLVMSNIYGVRSKLKETDLQNISRLHTGHTTGRQSVCLVACI